MTKLSEATEVSGVDVAPYPPPPVGSLVMTRALQLGLLELETQESPLGSNRGALKGPNGGAGTVDSYIIGHDGKGDWLFDLPPKDRPWCARFAVWLIGYAAQDLGMRDPLLADGRGSRGGRLASGGKIMLYGRQLRRLRGIPAAGMIGIITHDDGSSHVVIVFDVDREWLICLEGNSNNRVRLVRRARSEFSAFVEVIDLL